MYVINYINKNLANVKFKYVMIEKEFLVMVFSLSKLCHYVTRYYMFVHTNHCAIKYLMNKHVFNDSVSTILFHMVERSLR